MKYIQLHRNKWITADCKTIDEMIKIYESLTEYFKKMEAKGVTLMSNAGIEDDYAYLITDDPKVAKEFGFEPEEEYWEDDENIGSDEE